MALLAKRHRDWGCLLVLPPPTSNVVLRSVHGAFNSPAPKMRTSADSSQLERASLESCCSASSAHATTRTEAQRLGLLACLAPSIFRRSLGVWCRAPQPVLLLKCERLQIARRHKELACKTLAQPHLPMALLTQIQKDWDCLLVLPPQSSDVAQVVRTRRLRKAWSDNVNVCR